MRSLILRLMQLYRAFVLHDNVSCPLPSPNPLPKTFSPRHLERSRVRFAYPYFLSQRESPPSPLPHLEPRETGSPAYMRRVRHQPLLVHRRRMGSVSARLIHMTTILRRCAE